MKTKRSLIVILGVIAVCGFALTASAQATRTWVSGVGDDANPCSRTAPCKTFAGAISKTAAKGEINVLDPGGFGAVTITKSITISSEGFEAGVLVSGTNGIVVSAAATDVVILRGLDIEGLGTGLNGIQFLAGGTLIVEKCTINDFTQSGINFAPSAGTSTLSVKDTIVRNNNPTSGQAYAGVFVNPGASARAVASLDNVRLSGNYHGLRVHRYSSVTARNIVATSNTGNGFLVSTPTTTDLNIDDSEASNNGIGVHSDGATAIIRLSDSRVSGNTTGLSRTNSGQIISSANNRIMGNGTDGTFSSTVLQQ